MTSWLRRWRVLPVRHKTLLGLPAFKAVWLLVFIVVALLLWPVPKSTVEESGFIVEDSSGKLLRVWRNSNGQFRFPPQQGHSAKYRTAVVMLEDKRFAWHWGVDPLAVARAVFKNLSAGKITSGASTITLQVVRLRHPRQRTLWAKITEAVQAFHIELHWSKDRIFAEYSSLAPMGSNLVGVEAACWRFLGHSPSQMTWAEAALLAVLPNRPSWSNLWKRRENLQQRRDALLVRLAESGKMDSIDLQASLAEPLPVPLTQWPFRAPHFAEAMAQNHSAMSLSSTDFDGRLRTTLDLRVQGQVETRMRQHAERVGAMGVGNLAVLVMETTTGKVRAYAGSVDWRDTVQQGKVDGVRASRSTGSTLKPFLYGLALQQGPWNPRTALEDVPTWFGTFSPQNADKTYLGMVPLEDALTRSLNVPAVRMLSELGVETFQGWLQNAGLKHLFRTPEQYGLPLVLGGAESSLQELVPMYAMLYNDGKRTEMRTVEMNSPALGEELLHPGAAYLVLQMLTSVKRPEMDEYHAWFDNQIPAAWKTGTSYGSRDGWAIGVNGQWTIGVWAGNMKGGEVAGLTGSGTAAPLLFTLLRDLHNAREPAWKQPNEAWFRKVDVCPLSGHMRGPDCPAGHSIQVPVSQGRWQTCPMHQRVVTDKAGRYTVCSLCWNIADTAWSVQERYDPSVREILSRRGRQPTLPPPHNPQCPGHHSKADFEILTPQAGARIFLPRNLQGQRQSIILEAAHASPGQTLWWLLNGNMIGTTSGLHRLPVSIEEGQHVLTVQDTRGGTQQVRFRIFASPTNK